MSRSLKPLPIGKRFGFLTVSGFSHKVGRRKYALFLCDCGNQKTLRYDSVQGGTVMSCGCYYRIHKIKHGLVGSKEYGAWSEMKKRCYNKSQPFYHRYGGRGITVCRRWRYSFNNFLKDMGNAPSPKHSLGRIKNNGNYTPKNCEWQTQRKQARNTCTNVFYRIKGERKTLPELCEIHGLKYNTIRSRIDNGWNIKEALNLIPRRKK